MIVVDASAMVSYLVLDDAGRAIAGRLSDEGGPVHAPHLLDVEVASALARLVRQGALDARTAADALEQLARLDIERYPHGALVQRAWGLRDNVTLYDGVYVALAEALEATLVTSDRALARAAGHFAVVEVF